MPTRIKKMVIKITHCYPDGCEITDGRGNMITDNYSTNDYGDDTDSNYDHADDAFNTSDPPPGTPNDNIP